MLEQQNQEQAPKEKKKRNRKVFSKKEIVQIMQTKHLDHLGLSNKLIIEVVESFIQAYREAILTNKRVELAGLGTMRREIMKGRLLTHPISGSEAIASPYYRISFKPTKDLKEALRAKALEEVKKSEGQ